MNSNGSGNNPYTSQKTAVRVKGLQMAVSTSKSQSESGMSLVPLPVMDAPNALGITFQA